MVRHVATSTLVCLAALMTVAPGAFAQTGAPAASTPAETRVFVSVNGGLQVRSTDFLDSNTFTLFDEQGRFERRYDIEGGSLFDISGAVRVWHELAVGIGVTAFQDSDNAPVTGQVPHPAFFDSPRAFTAEPGHLDHRQTAVHLSLHWLVPAPGPLSLTLSAGPSFFTAKQDVVTAVTTSEVGPPFSTVNVTPTITEREDSAVGFHIGADAAYMITRHFGAGLFVRFASATAHIALASGADTDIDLGGFQIGAGGRIRF